MPSIYTLLAIVQVTSVAQFILDKSGYGRLEDRDGAGVAILMLISMPLMWLLFLGQVVGTIWAMFAVSFWHPIAIFLATQFVFGSLLWYIMGVVQVKGYQYQLYRIGVPLVFFIRLTCALASFFLLRSLWTHS